MGSRLDAVGQWPRNRGGEPIWKTGEEAIFYATLIYDNRIFCDEVTKVRNKAIKEVKECCKRPSANLDRLHIVATKGQFARECLEEVQRLKDLDILP